MEVDPLETKLDHIVDVIEKTIQGETDKADVGEPQSEEAAKQRLRIVAAHLTDMRERIAEITKRRNTLAKKLELKKKRADDLRGELRQKRAERDLYRKIAEEYSSDKKAKDVALVRANAVTFCLLLKESILE
jgi:Na+/phosphate symporter